MAPALAVLILALAVLALAVAVLRRPWSPPLVDPAMVIATDQRTATIRPGAVREAFYGRCSDEDAALAASLLVPEPLAPLATTVHVTDGRFGSVPRVYVECARPRGARPQTVS